MKVIEEGLLYPIPDFVDLFLHFLCITKFLVKSGGVVGVLQQQRSLQNRYTFQFVSIKEKAEG